MAGRRRVIELATGEEDLAALRAIARSRTESASRVERARMLLAYREDPSFFAVGRTLGVHHQTVQRCVERALACGPLAALDDLPRPGREPQITAEAKACARLVGKSELMAESDAISIHMVLSPRSRGIIGAENINRMKEGAILINTSRGPLIDEPALVAAVNVGRIIAALDVYDKEPLPESHPLRASGHTVLTPHLGYGVAETWRDFYPRSIENAEAFLDGRPIRVLNAL